MLKKIGRLPKGHLKKRIENSQYYKNKQFENLVVTPVMTEGVSRFDIIKSFFKAKKNTVPAKIPIVQTNLYEIDAIEEYLIWFGHSSYLLKILGYKFLVDPVFSGNASPIPNIIKQFPGTEYYNSEKIPKIDYLVITHDHYDHLDYKTVVELKNKVEKVIVPLGVSEHFIYWGYDKENIIELEWGEKFELNNNIKIISEPSHHASGRTIKLNQSLWTSYVLQVGDRNIFLGGDGAYGNHFSAIGDKYGKFDLALLENGQYNKLWKYSHMFPNETLQAAKDMNVQTIIPIHNSKFKLSDHEWNEPLKEITNLNNKIFNINLLTPKIGEVVNLNDLEKKSERWFD